MCNSLNMKLPFSSYASPILISLPTMPSKKRISDTEVNDNNVDKHCWEEIIQIIFIQRGCFFVLSVNFILIISNTTFLKFN